MREKKIFLYMAASAYQVISKEVKIISWDTIGFLDTHAIYTTHIDKWRNYYIFMQYHIVISGTLVRSFLDVLFLLLDVILTGPHEKPRRNKDWVTEKKYIEEFVCGASLLGLNALVSMSFCVLSSSIYSPFPNWRTWWMASIKIHNIAMGVFCVMLSWVNGRKYESL